MPPFLLSPLSLFAPQPPSSLSLFSSLARSFLYQSHPSLPLPFLSLIFPTLIYHPLSLSSLSSSLSFSLLLVLSFQSHPFYPLSFLSLIFPLLESSFFSLCLFTIFFSLPFFLSFSSSVIVPIYFVIILIALFFIFLRHFTFLSLRLPFSLFLLALQYRSLFPNLPSFLPYSRVLALSLSTPSAHLVIIPFHSLPQPPPSFISRWKT